MPEAELEIRSCPLCQQDSGSLVAREGIYQLYRCQCGMVYTRNPPGIAGKRARYQASSGSLPGLSYHNLSSQIRSIPLYSKVLQHLVPSVSRQSEINLVDAGCAGGLFLLGTQVAENPGLPRIIARGLAFDPAEKLATEYHTGFGVFMLEEAERLNNWAEVVTALNVLEHVNHTQVFLETIRAVLKPKGLLVVDVPNNQVLIWKAGLARRWPHLDLGEHINHFTPQTLDALLARHGFALKERLAALVQGASGFGLAPSGKQYLRWLGASCLFHLSSRRLQLFSHYTAIYQKENGKKRTHEA